MDHAISGGRKVSLKGPLPLANMDLHGTTAKQQPRPVERAPATGASPAIDLPTLSRAVRHCVGHDGMRKEDADAIATHLLNFFGFNERIIDNVLEPDDRDTFYMLEDAGILETERDETTLYDGREWRIHYWMFRKDRILRYAREELLRHGEEEPVPPEPHISGGRAHAPASFPPMDTSVYHELGDEAWSQRDPNREPMSLLSAHKVARSATHPPP